MSPREKEKVFNITVDMHEQRSGLGRLLEDSRILSVSYAELPVGDIVLSEEVVVERKEATDLVLSIMDRRLFSQVAQMKATFSCPVILIEGDPFETRSGIDPTALRGALSWMAVIEGLRVVHTKNVKDTAAFVEVMTRHAQQGLGYLIPSRCSKPKDLGFTSQFIVEGLPSIGPASAKKLLNYFGSVSGVMNATVEELQAVDGIGRKTAERIREAVEFEIPGGK